MIDSNVSGAIHFAADNFPYKTITDRYRHFYLYAASLVILVFDRYHRVSIITNAIIGLGTVIIIVTTLKK